MKSVLVILLLAMTTSAFSQTQGLGLRIGNTLGLTYKKHLANDRAFELLMGTAPSGWNQEYYRESYNNQEEYDSYTYHSHEVENNVSFQGRYLFQYDISAKRMLGKLNWYWGAGVLFKFARVKYHYFYPYELGPGGSSVLLEDRQPDIDFGPEAITGIEYTFGSAPLSLFGEVSGFLELADNPTFRAFASAGIRYNF